ncbi:MAG: choice-of-anchor U domain-containing protein [Acidovorax sp.]|uniref:choice-of-anchor U domain-containing protein n=1 Tax=Acidovorax sp. TaxID=1872122 RepID=UPI00391CD6FD
MFQFRASGCVLGSTLPVAITYPNPLPINVQFWKYGPAVPAAASTWSAHPGATLSPDRRAVTYSITDNGIGDSGSTNGVVLDPLGAALAPPGAGVTSVPGLSPRRRGPCDAVDCYRDGVER